MSARALPEFQQRKALRIRWHCQSVSAGMHACMPARVAIARGAQFRASEAQQRMESLESLNMLATNSPGTSALQLPSG